MTTNLFHTLKVSNKYELTFFYQTAICAFPLLRCTGKEEHEMDRMKGKHKGNTEGRTHNWGHARENKRLGTYKTEHVTGDTREKVQQGTHKGEHVTGDFKRENMQQGTRGRRCNREHMRENVQQVTHEGEHSTGDKR